MGYEAATWRPGVPHRPFEEVFADPAFAVYLEGWPRPGDAAVVAEDETGRPLGAAWYRRFTEDAHGYGFVDASTPELSISVEPDARGRGIGTALLEALIGQARSEGHAALSLSVEEDNPAVRLYEGLGFVRAARNGNAWTMRLDLRASGRSRRSGPAAQTDAQAKPARPEGGADERRLRS